MHASHLPATVLERAIATRGDEPIAVNPAKTAHIVIDMQNGFVAPGSIFEVPAARGILSNINRISQAMRDAGGSNIFIRFTVDPDEPRHWGSFYERMSTDAKGVLLAALGRGAEQYQLVSDLDVQDNDLIIDKTRFSAFIPGTCTLHDKLQAKDIDTLIVTGTLTNACCESTVRDAMQMGYKVVFVQDGTATWDDETHNATLANMAIIFADVCTSDEVIFRIMRKAESR